MPASVSIVVEPDIKGVAAKLKALDAQNGTRLRKDLAAAMRKIGDEFVKAEQAAIRGTKIKGVKKGGGLRHKRGGKPLPEGHGKGIREPIAKAIMKRNRLTGQQVGVEIRVSKGKMPPSMANIPSAAQRGMIRHPLFGDTSQWYGQAVMPAGWWSKTGREQMVKSRADLIRVGKEFEKAVEAAMRGNG